MNAADDTAQNEWMGSLLGDFLDESGQLLERLNENLLQLDVEVRAAGAEDAACDQNRLNEMFRAAHSLKGLSAMLGLSDINHLTHRLENVFDAARREELAVTDDVVELMFRSVDQLEKLIELLKDPDAEQADPGTVVDAIQALLQSHGVERKASTQAEAEHALAGTATAEPPAAAERPPVQTAGAAADDPFGGICDEAQVSDRYLSIFIDEAGIAVERLGETLLGLEGGGSPAHLKNLLITAHQVKGSAASVGLNRVAKLAHLMEDLLQDLSESSAGLSAEAADTMLRCVDRLRQYLDSLKTGRPNSDGFEQLATELLGIRGNAGESKAATTRAGAGRAGGRAATSGIDDALRQRVRAATPEGATAMVGHARFEPLLPMAGLKAQLVYDKLANFGDICHFEPPAEQLDELDALEDVRFGLVTEKPAEMVRRHLMIGGVEQIWLESLAPQAAERGPAADARPAADAARGSQESQPVAAGNRGGGAEGNQAPTETLRVDIERLDELMNLAGQLVISKARFSQFGDRLRTLRASRRWGQSLGRILGDLGRLGDGSPGQEGPAAVSAALSDLRVRARRIQGELEHVCAEMRSLEGIHDSMNELSEAVHQLDRVSDGIQRAVMDTRMVPIGPLFTRFKRVIRDITRSNGKSIRLVINGEKTKLDKRMIDELGDPLIHMVRNSADHGIELPEARRAAGKPAEGTVTLDAFHRGNYVVIEVRDDGAGLNTERILRKAIDKGLVTAADAARLTPHQVQQLIWAPGLSTAEKITEVSGRGMGMDIVKSKIETLHGTVETRSTPGQGTTLSIKLPLTLAIQPSLLVEIGGDVFALPMESVLEIVRVGEAQLATVHGQRTAWIRASAISVVELDHVLSWSGPAKRDRARASADVTLVIVGETSQRLGLAVDRVLGEEDVVIKSIAENYRNVPGITGASILGDGRVSLILDVATLVQMAARGTASPAPLEQNA